MGKESKRYITQLAHFVHSSFFLALQVSTEDTDKHSAAAGNLVRVDVNSILVRLDFAMPPENNIGSLYISGTPFMCVMISLRFSIFI